MLIAGTTLPLTAKTVKTNVAPDTLRVLRNPLNGWVMYGGRSWDDTFWQEKGYDRMQTTDGPVRVSDYANTFYLRTSWASLNPEEDVYTWNDPDSRLMRVLRSALNRNMKLAFRIVVDGRDQGLNTPAYVFKAGAKGFKDPNNPNVTCPYPEDSVFQAKFEKFLTAMATYFNDPDKVDFIDAFGLGKWGEAHAVKYADYTKKHAVYDWITSLYACTFTRIPLIINYHRMVADTLSWASPRPDSRQLLESAIAKGYSLRHDAFGMTGYYEQWERDFADQWRFRRPIIMEGGWITGGQHRYWIDPSGQYRKGHPEDVRHGEYEASREAHVNMMDMRVGDETRSWFEDCFPLVKQFVKEGGYRLYPSEVCAPDRAKAAGEVTLSHSWENMGWGYCPTNIPQWNYKYKVGIALVDAQGRIAQLFVDDSTDPGRWIKGTPTSYDTTFRLNVPKGKYRWAIGLVDKTKDNAIGLQMAVPEKDTAAGWLMLNEIRIK